MRLQFWAADTLRFSVTGPEPHRFLNRAAAAGVRLRRVRWQRDGYAATVSGADRRRLERIARDGGWTLAVTAAAARESTRSACCRPVPGWPRGPYCFCCWLRALGGLVWCIDFGAMDAVCSPPMRRLLADCGIHEGVLLTKPLLQTAQGTGFAPQRGVRLDQPELYGRLPCHREHALPDPDRAGAAAPAGPVRQCGRGNTRR